MKHLTLMLVFLALTGTSLAESIKFGTPEHKVVIHVNTANPQSQKAALNHVTNLLKYYGPQSITIEVVANGPGLSIMMPGNPESPRIPAMAKNGVGFSACSVTMGKLKKKTGKEVTLVEGVHVVPAGIPTVIEFQEKGYAYVRP